MDFNVIAKTLNNYKKEIYMNKNLETISLEQQKAQLEVRKKAKFFEDGYVDGYHFAYWLGQSLWLDGFNIEYSFKIVALMLSFASEEQFNSKKIFTSKIDYISSDDHKIYPEGETIFFHISYFLDIHEIISAIGTEVIGIPRTENDRLYSWWLKREHIYTCTYFDSFFRDFTNILSSHADFKQRVMNLHISRHIPDEDFSAYLTIVEKEQRFIDVLARINRAVDQEFYLEAIALEESCISDRLSLILYIKGLNAGTKNFAKLIEICSEFIPKTLKTDIDAWRIERNKSIHNLVRSSPLETLIALDKLDEISAITAKKGKNLIVKVNEWFEDFILTEMNPYHFRIPDENTPLNS